MLSKDTADYFNNLTRDPEKARDYVLESIYLALGYRPTITSETPLTEPMKDDEE